MASQSTSSAFSARSLPEPLSAWLDDNYRRATLRDHLDIFILPPDHISESPSSDALDPDTEALAQTVTLVEKSR
jgi:hypothetical protein